MLFIVKLVLVGVFKALRVTIKTEMINMTGYQALVKVSMDIQILKSINFFYVKNDRLI